MLAKEWKIRKLKEQREFIERTMEEIFSKREDGDLSYSYIGHIFPEVKEYFKKEGFTIIEVKDEQVSDNPRGFPVYLFIPNEQVLILSEEELKQAEEYEPDETSESQNLMDGGSGHNGEGDPIDAFLGAIFGR